MAKSERERALRSSPKSKMEIEIDYRNIEIDFRGGGGKSAISKKINILARIDFQPILGYFFIVHACRLTLALETS